MHEWQSLSHVGWECKYHVVIIPKYRRKVFYGKLRRQIGAILRELCCQRGVELPEGYSTSRNSCTRKSSLILATHWIPRGNTATTRRSSSRATTCTC